jgi:hypothetical protein
MCDNEEWKILSNSIGLYFVYHCRLAPLRWTDLTIIFIVNIFSDMAFHLYLFLQASSEKTCVLILVISVITS